MGAGSRGAMRKAANQPIEMTRYYIRLWALYYAACQAELKGEKFEPIISSAADTRTK